MVFFKKKIEPKKAQSSAGSFSQKVPEALSGLGKHELVNIYNIAKVSRLQQGEYLFRENDPEDSLYLVVEGILGRFKSVRGKERKLWAYSKNDWIGKYETSTHSLGITSVKALGGSQIMEINIDDLESIPLETKLYIYRKLNGSFSRRVNTLMTRYVFEAEEHLSFIRDLNRKNDSCISSSLVQSIISKIPKLPMYAVELARKLLDERVSPAEITGFIKADPSLAALILKKINSPYYGLPEKVSDIHRGFLLLGFTQVYNLVLEDGINRTMPQTPEFSLLQRHSYMISLFSTSISLARTEGKSSVDIATIALLHDIGKSIILLLKRQNPNIAILIDFLDTFKIGAALLKTWGLPERISSIVQFQSNTKFIADDQVPVEIKTDLATLYLAHRCYDYLVDGKGGEGSVFFIGYMDFLKLPQKTIAEFCQQSLLPRLLTQKKQLPAEYREFFESKC